MCGLRFTCLLGFLAATGWCPLDVHAGVFTGTIENVSGEARKISVKIARKDRAQTFNVRASATITVDNKPVTLDELEVGQTVAVTTNGIDEVTKLTVRTAAAKPNEKKPPEKKPAKKPTGKAPDDEDDGPPASKVAAKPKPSGKKPMKPSTTGEDAAAGEWPQFRGPNRDNVSLESGLLDEWPDGGPKLAWKQTGIGEAYSSVAVAHGKVYTMGNKGNDEMLIALDAATGEQLWSLRTGKAFRNNTGDGPRGTPAVDADRVYALGGNGDLVCAGAEKGDIVWHVNILDEFGGQNIGWGISESVLVDGDHVICTPGGKQATIAALDKHTGKTVWRSMIQGQPQAAYSSAIAIEVNGVRQYVNFVHTALVGVSARDGKPLWGERRSANGTANCSSPLFADNTVFSASGYGTGGALVKLAGSNSGMKSTLAYHTPKMKNHHGGMAAVDGFIYGFDEDVLTCMEMQSGNVQWQDRSVGKGSLTVADGKLFLRSEGGPVALAKVTAEAYQEVGRFNQPDRSRNAAWSHPAVANGKLYLRDMDTLLVYDVKE